MCDQGILGYLVLRRSFPPLPSQGVNSSGNPVTFLMHLDSHLHGNDKIRQSCRQRQPDLSTII